MKNTTANGLVLLLLGGVLLFAITFTAIPTYLAGPVGYIRAYLDVSLGRYHVIIPRGYARKETRTFLKTHYGIDTQLPTGSCITPPEFIAYHSAYQSVVQNAIKRKYGRDVVAESMADWKGPFSGARQYELFDFMDVMRTTFSSEDSPRIKETIEILERSVNRLGPSLDQASKDKLTEILDQYLLSEKRSRLPESREVQYAAIYALESTGGEAAMQVLERLSKDPDTSIAKAATNAASSLAQQEE